MIDIHFQSIKKTAEMLGVSERWLRKQINSADPPPHFQLDNQKVLVRSDEAVEYMEKYRAVAPEPRPGRPSGSSAVTDNFVERLLERKR